VTALCQGIEDFAAVCKPPGRSSQGLRQSSVKPGRP